MNFVAFFARFRLVALLGLCLSTMACDDRPAPPPEAKPAPVDAKRAPLGKNVWLEVQGEQRRVLIDATVSLREGLLEQFLCRKNTKEHEAILAADIDARDVHKALLVAGAKPGSPAKFDPKFEPPTGTTIRVFIEYEVNGKLVRVPARTWVRNLQTKKELDTDWVFAGSRLVPQEEGKPPYYMANGGDVICVSNFPDAMLDLPISSSKDNDTLAFEAFAERIPQLETKVTVILEPVVAGR